MREDLVFLSISSLTVLKPAFLRIRVGVEKAVEVSS
jgi:hypothetical protein